jgi:hypothetical protein
LLDRGEHEAGGWGLVEIVPGSLGRTNRPGADILEIRREFRAILFEQHDV